MSEMDFKDPHFKNCFWNWFDALPDKEKKRFQYYTADMAELYFYNKFYSRISYSGNTSDFQSEARGSSPSLTTINAGIAQR